VSLSGNLLRGNAIESFDRVAQVAEQRTFNPQVLGSNPSPVILLSSATPRLVRTPSA
jgi:hypothetical protein